MGSADIITMMAMVFVVTSAVTCYALSRVASKPPRKCKHLFGTPLILVRHVDGFSVYIKPCLYCNHAEVVAVREG